VVGGTEDDYVKINGKVTRGKRQEWGRRRGRKKEANTVVEKNEKKRES